MSASHLLNGFDGSSPPAIVLCMLVWLHWLQRLQLCWAGSLLQDAASSQALPSLKA